MEEREKEEAVAARAKAGVHKKGERPGAARAVPKGKVCSEGPSNI